jgi:Kef-type K+ transport system membrane component KefB
MHQTNNPLFFLLIAFFIAIIARLTKLINQPTIIGEIILGVIFINILNKFAPILANNLIHSEFLANIAVLGSIFLLLEVGLETNFTDLVNNKKYAILVALTGVLIPFICGYFIVVPYILHIKSSILQIFMGSFFAVTSTGVSISLFKDLKILKTQASQIVLGASIIDDIIGLLLLSISVSMIKFGYYDNYMLIIIIVKLVVFLISIYLINKYILKYIQLKFINNHEFLFIIIIFYTLFCSYIADKVGLAMVIGAFLAGLGISSNSNNGNGYFGYVISLRTLFTPLFFVYSGMQINITNFFDYKLVLESIIIGLIAIMSKLSSIILISKRVKHRSIIAFGMVPRGEIGLVFALTGFNLGLLSSQVFTILMLVIIYTTIITPIAINLIIKN